MAGIQGSEVSALSDSILSSLTHGPADGSGTVVVPDARLLFGGDFKQSGLDLILSKDGREFTIHDYFRGDRHADLTSPDGARLTGSLVDSLTAGHAQYAQASGAADAARSIGQVTKLTGTATAIRNGVAVELHVGDNVMKGDVVQCGGSSILTLTFVDGTVFGLSANARMVLNEMVYDPNGSSNTSLLSLVQGTISFVAGETAKHGDMKIDTPVATMGIRGTAGFVEIGFDIVQATAPPVQFRILVEPGNVVGRYLLFSKTDPNTPIGSVDRNGIATFVAPNGNITQVPAPPLSDVAKQIITETLSTYFPGYFPDLNNANPQSGPGSHGSPPWGQGPDGLPPIPQLFPLNTPTNVTIPINFQNNSDQDPFKQTVTITVLSSAPTVTAASFTVHAGQFVILNPDDIQASDPEGHTNFTFNVSNVQHGVFQITTDGVHWVDTTTFTTNDLNAHHVRFLADNSNQPPAFSIQANNGQTVENLSDFIDGSPDFVPHPAPVITVANFAVTEGQPVVLTGANFVVTDNASSDFTFKLSNVTHGVFQITTDGGQHWVDTDAFTTADLNAGHVRFLSDHSGLPPTFAVQVDDGLSVNPLSTVVPGSVDFTGNVPPEISEASFAVTEGGTVILHTSNFVVSDPDNSAFTFTVSGVTHGTFQIFVPDDSEDGGHWVDTDTFTTADLAAGHVRFQHDGSEYPPTFSVHVDDGSPIDHSGNTIEGSVDFTNVNDAPVITTAELAVSEGGTVTLTASDFAVTDPDSSSFIFTVSGVTHGTFQVYVDDDNDEDGHWVDTNTFTTADLEAGHVRFHHDGSEYPPTFSVHVDDGASVNHSGNTIEGEVDFTNVNDPPVITHAGFAVSEGGTVVLTSSDIVVSDPDSTSFTFTVSQVTHGHFEVKNGNVWSLTSTFTSAQLDAGQVRFVDNGDEQAPTFTIVANDGANINNLSVPVTGAIQFTNVDDPPYITGTTATGSVPSNVLTAVAAAYLTDDHDLVNGLGGASGFGTALTRNDDGSSQSIDLTGAFGASGLNFFGHNYTHLWVNNNGNITFNGPSSTFTPGTISAGSNPIIAAFWADVDTRGGATTASPGGNSTGSNLVYYNLDTTNHVLTVTWDDVGYYNGHINHVDAFQLQLIGLGDGNFDIVFRYESIDWTTGDASGGHDGLGGSVARVGYSAGDGNPAHYFELPGSGNQSAMLNLDTALGNTGIAGVDVFQVISGSVSNAPIASGTVSFADPDDNSHSVSFQPEGAGYKGSFTLDPISESNGTGSVSWHFSLTTSEINTITTGSPLVQSYDITISDGHPGGQTTQTVSVMVGSAGNDTLTGDHGVDVMIGGGGNDTFVFQAHIGQQTVVDFKPGVDKIDISQVDGVTADNFASWLNGGNGFAAHAAQVGNDVVIDLDQTPHGTDTIVLKSIALANLHSSDFIVHSGAQV